MSDRGIRFSVNVVISLLIDIIFLSIGKGITASISLSQCQFSISLSFKKSSITLKKLKKLFNKRILNLCKEVYKIERNLIKFRIEVYSYVKKC